jgi:hypothetical protein
MVFGIMNLARIVLSSCRSGESAGLPTILCAQHGPNSGRMNQVMASARNLVLRLCISLY